MVARHVSKDPGTGGIPNAWNSDRLHPEDANVIPPQVVPEPLDGKGDAIWRVGKLTFRADFDSANLHKVEQGVTHNEFMLFTRRDCSGSANERATRTWFYFGVSGHSATDLVMMQVMNLNKQGRLYSQDYRPVFWCASMAEWQPLRLKVTYRREGDDFQLRFCHRFDSDEETFFAFAIPFSYSQTQDMLERLDQAYATCGWQGPDTWPAAGQGLGRAQGGAMHIEDPAEYGSTPEHVLTAASPRSDHHHCTWDEARGSGSSSSSLRPSATSPRRSPTGGLEIAHREHAAAPATVSNASTISGCHHQGGAAGASAAFCCSPSGRWGSQQGHSGGHQPPHPDTLYYRRQLLTLSVEGRRVDVITISDCWGATGGVEPPVPGVFEHDPGPPAAEFAGKKVFFVTSRVHPGETPASHMFNGMLAFLLRSTDPRVAALRRRFVFKLVPLMNPDGVAGGNYRADTLGQNLNRFYNGEPDKDLQPSVHAVKALLLHYARQGSLEFYLDLHAHANKKGVFIYGNVLDGEAQLQSLLYAKLIAINNPMFDFLGCNYTEKNMSRSDKDGSSKEGAGRVALYRETGLTHLYTIEANYNTARCLNVVPPAGGDHGGRASPPCSKRFPPKFTAGILQGVGRAVLVAALDMAGPGANPWSRLPNSEYRSAEGVRSWLLSVLRAPPDTRAVHLPPVSDAAVEAARGMGAPGAGRLGAGLAASGVARGRGPPASYDSPSSSAMGYSSTSSAAFSPSPSASPIAFGRTLSNPTSARRPPAHPARTSRPSPSPPNVPHSPGPSHTWQASQRGAKMSRVSSAGMVHSSSGTPSTTSGSGARAGTHHAHSAHGGSGAGPAGRGRAGGYSTNHSGGFGRSASLPVRSSAHGAPPRTPAGSASAAVLARRLSAEDDPDDQGQGQGQGQRQRGSSSGYTPAGEAPLPLPSSPPALAGAGGVPHGPRRPASSDGPSDSDGDSDEGPAELPPPQRSPAAAATAAPTLPRPGSARFRPLDGRAASLPVYRGSVPYNAPVPMTEFRIPLVGRSSNTHETVGGRRASAAGEHRPAYMATRGRAAASAPSTSASAQGCVPAGPGPSMTTTTTTPQPGPRPSMTYRRAGSARRDQ